MKDQKVFDYALWVDRSKILPKEENNSMTLDISMADYVIDNNKDIIYLREQINAVMNYIL